MKQVFNISKPCGNWLEALFMIPGNDVSLLFLKVQFDEAIFYYFLRLI